MIQFPKITNNTSMYSNTANKYVSAPNFGIRMQNPLSCDTVSFSGKNGDARYSQAIRYGQAVRMERAANSIADLLVKKLGDVDELKDNEIYGRGKRAHSIARKFITDGIIKLDDDAVIRKENFSKTKDVNNFITDIVGTRIVMNNIGSIDDILNGIKSFMNKTGINIIQIENKYPKSDKEGAGSYVSKDSLEDLNNTAMERLGKLTDFKPNDQSPVGYTALHILMKLPKNIKQEGLGIAELQIMGPAVAKLKDVEDFCYKIKDIGYLDAEYKQIEDILKILTDKENHSDLISAHKAYTKAAYIKQFKKEKYASKLQNGKKSKKDKERVKEKENEINDSYGKFLTIEEFVNTAPNIKGLSALKKHPELDFNNLAKIAEECRKSKDNQ